MSEEFDDLSVLDDIDIPEVVRDEDPEQSEKTTGSNPKQRLLLGLGGILIVGFGAIASRQFFQATPDPAAPEDLASDVSPSESGSNDTETSEQILGHFPYPEAEVSELVAVSADGRLKLRPAAAEKFLQMQADARQAGINLALLSAFRTIEEQQYLFFDIKEQRAQDTTKRAEVSAPPRYSEHHTGYAIDLGDGNLPATHLQENFENTAAFQWLQNNAARYSFELSFPRDNPQGIAYEPWHWRFVGDQDSLETFYKSRNLNP
ncbi:MULTISPECIES: M15 family metallopeptidase [Cyanophyceae]|uniref:M15 family metallopeptidase n=1 Tax=Cyanophyceae TaxID=3028117 RepID=UPI000A777CFD|nr:MULTISPECIES: M15 family metallopeptidase [Cyanophyceae]